MPRNHDLTETLFPGLIAAGVAAALYVISAASEHEARGRTRAAAAAGEN